MPPTPPRGAELVDLVIAHVRCGACTLAIPEPRPVPGELLDRLAFADGTPLPPSLRRWLAFDAAWLAAATGLMPAVDTARLPGAFLLDLVAQQWPEHDLAATFADLATALPARAVLLDRDETAFRALYLGSPDKHGEYPVLSIDIDDPPPIVSADHAGFDLWLAAMAGLHCRGTGRAGEITECRRRLFGAAMALQMLGPCPPLDRDPPPAVRLIAEGEPDESEVELETAPEPAERAADRLDEAIGLGNRRRISAGLIENAGQFPTGPWRTRAVIAALYRLSDEILAEVLAAGGDPNAQGEGGSALALAAHLGAAGKVRLLLDAGASTRSRDRRGSSPLIAAASRNHHEVVALLLARGADPDPAHDGEGAPIHHAAQHGRVDTVQLLLAHGASLEARNGCGDTPLHVAVKHEHPEVARLLLERGARRDLANQDGWTVDSLIDTRGQARREVSVTYRASEEVQDLVVEIELVTWDRSRLAPDLPLRLGRVLARLVGDAAAGGLGGDRFQPSQSLAEVRGAPPTTLVPLQARHALRWQLRVAGLPPAGLAVMLSPFFRPIHEARVVRLTVTGTLPLDNSRDTLIVTGPDAHARIAALAAELRRQPKPHFPVQCASATRLPMSR